MWGKVKTVVQMFTVILLICDFNEVTGKGITGEGGVYIAEQIMIYLAMALTVISLIDYIVKNKDVITSFK